MHTCVVYSQRVQRGIVTYVIDASSRRLRVGSWDERTPQFSDLQAVARCPCRRHVYGVPTLYCKIQASVRCCRRALPLSRCESDNVVPPCVATFDVAIG